MTHTEFFSAIARGDIAQAYLFQGAEEHVKASALEALRKKILPEGLEAMNETLLTSPSASDLIAAAETLPFMGERRLVLARDSALLTSGRAAGEAEDSAKLADYLDRLPETVCIVFYIKGAPDGRKKLAQALAKKAVVVKFEPLGDAELNKWIQQNARAQGKTVAPDVAAFLAFTVGRELLTLSQELGKVIAYVGERAEITRGDVEAVATPSLECTVFQMVDALVERREADALRLLNIMLEHGEARIGILAMMARQYRNLLHLKLMQAQNVPEGEMQKRLGVPPFALRRLYAQSKNAQADALREKLDLCVDTDYAIKSGQMREDAALERAILLLCG